MKRLLTCLTAVLCAVMMMTCACAESITLNGKVIPADTIQIYASAGGTVETVGVEAGQKVSADDVLYSLKTSKVYAERDGKVSGIFGRPGDDAESVATRYGGVLYLEQTPAYTVSASTSGAYNSMETKYVHPGENVYVVSRNSANRYGKGIITTISGESYTVEITEGNFLTGETVEVFRDPEYDYHQRIGKGTVTYSDPVAVTADGAIVGIAVEDGAEVKRGDVLLETLDGTFDAYVMTGTEITAGQAGVIGNVNVQAGSGVEKGSVAVEIYPLDRMRVEANIPEDYCNQVKEGDPVTIELVTEQNKTYTGTVVMISSIATEGEDEEVTYRIVAEFAPDETVRFGMTAQITAGEEEESEREEEPEEEESAEETEQQESEKKERPSRSEGMPEWNGEGERPEKPEGGWPERTSETGEAPAESPVGETPEAGESTEGQ